MASVLTTSCSSGPTSTIATSSVRSKAPGAPAASGAKWRAISSNSSGNGRAATGAILQFVGPQRMRQAVENRVHQLRFLLVVEGFGDVDIFLDRHARRHVQAVRQLIAAGPQHDLEH